MDDRVDQFVRRPRSMRASGERRKHQGWCDILEARVDFGDRSLRAGEGQVDRGESSQAGGPRDCPRGRRKQRACRGLPLPSSRKLEISTRPRLGIFPRRQRLQGTDRFRSSADWVAASRGAAAAEVSDARMSATSDKYRNFAGAHLKWMFTTVKARTKMGSAYRRPAATLD